MKRSFSQIAGAATWFILIISQWVHSQFVAPSVTWWLDNVVSSAEQSVLTSLREGFAFFARVINGIASWFVAIFVDRRHIRDKEHSRPRAWKAFWSSTRSSTFNAVIEQEGLIAGTSRKRTPSPEPETKQKRHVQKVWSGRSWFSYIATLPPFSWILFLFTRLSRSKNLSNKQGKRSPKPSKKQPRTSSSQMKRSGSELFNHPSGFGVAQQMQRRRGFLEDTRLTLEMAVATTFETFRSVVQSIFRLKQHQHYPIMNGNNNKTNQHPSDAWVEGTNRPKLPTALPPIIGGGAGGNKSWEDVGVWTASDIILLSGYPLEEHVVTTSDGYILTMQRLPRKDSKEVVFFQHGVLDTSLSWVSNGPQGSQAFAAFDRGADVWLGNSRANPPRAHTDSEKSGFRYWAFSINELGTEDTAAQLDHIHAVKTAELSASVMRSGQGLASSGVVSRNTAWPASGGNLRRRSSLDAEDAKDAIALGSSSGGGIGGEASTTPLPMLHRVGSDSALTAMHQLEVAAESYTGGPDCLPPNEQRLKDKLVAQQEQEQINNNNNAAPTRTSSSRGSLDMLTRFWPGKKKPPSRVKSSTSSVSFDTASSSPTVAKSAGRYVPLAAKSMPAHRPYSAGPRSFSLTQAASEPRVGASEEDDDDQRNTADVTLSRPLHRGQSVGAAGLDAFPLPDLSSVSPFEDADETLVSASSGSCQSLASTHSVGASSVRTTPRVTIPTAESSDSLLLTPDRVSVGGKEQSIFPGFSVPDQRGYGGGILGEGASPRLSLANSLQSDLQSVESLKQPKAPGEFMLSASPSLHLSEGGAATPEGRQLYSIQAVAHSLGGAALLIHAVMCKMVGRPHRLSRLVLLSPAGFHSNYPKGATPFLYILPIVMAALNRLRPGLGMPAYIPSSLLRYIAFKLTVDMEQIPALNELTRAALRLLLNGDKSEWDRALQMPHYSYTSMPAISLHTGAHLIQLMWSRKFCMYDYGSSAANMAHYGRPTPPNVADHYDLLRGLPIDLVAGKSDGVVDFEDVLMHYEAMKAAGLQVSYKELDAGHLDVTFAVKDEVQHYVMSRLQLGGLRG